MRTCLLVCAMAAVLWQPSTVRAQGLVTSFDELASRLVAGAYIDVSARSGEKYRGAFQKLTSIGLQFLVDGRPVELASADIVEIHAESEAIGWWAVPVGAGVGFAWGYHIGSYCAPGCEGSNWGPVVGLAGAGIGAGIGAAVHFLAFKQVPVYRSPRPSPSKQVMFSAVMTRSCRALVIVVGF
jgi:hypothetical protein